MDGTAGELVGIGQDGWWVERVDSTVAAAVVASGGRDWNAGKRMRLRWEN